MDKKRLHEVVCMMKAAALELRKEYNEASCKKSDWYDHWLEELKKGNVTDEWFNKNVWEPYQSFELHLMAGEDITRLENIADQLEFVNRKLMGQREKIDELYNETKGE